MKAFPALLGSLALALTVFLAPPAAAAACVACGDATGDCVVTAADALRVLKAAVGLPVTCLPERCDFNGDGKIRTGDALGVLKLAVGVPVVGKCPKVCTQAADCPDTGNECATAACVQGYCGKSFVSAGTPVSQQMPGDCSTVVCDGQGSTTQQANAGDLPSDGNPCTDDACSPQPSYVPNTAACDDGSACTLGDQCSAGQCVPGTPRDCDDGNPCTDDSCNPASGCRHLVVNGVPCDDGDACTVGDQCTQGRCVAGGAANCDDSNPCTTDFCSPTTGACLHGASNGTPCDDGNACTSGDQCSAGVCRPGSNICNLP